MVVLQNNQGIKSNRGISLVEVLVAVGISAIVGYGVLTLVVNSTKAVTTTRTAVEAQDIFNEIKAILANSVNCTETFKNENINPVTGWAISTGTFGVKEFPKPPAPAGPATVKFKIGDGFGIGKAVRVKGYSIKEDDQHKVIDHKAVLHVLFTRNEGSYSRDIERITPLWINTDADGILTECRSLFMDDQIWRRSQTELSNIFYDGLSNSPDRQGLIAMGIDDARMPATVHIHRGGGNAVLGITATANNQANILFCPDLATGATNIKNNCGINAWELNTSNLGFKIKTSNAGNLAASFNFSDVSTGSGLLFTIPAIDTTTFTETPDKGVAFSADGLIIANRPTQGNLSLNKSCSAAFGGDTSGSCAGAAGAFYTGEGFALGTAFAYQQGVPNGWVGGAPGLLAGESVTTGSAGAFQISGKGMFIAENSTLGDVIACYNNFDTTLVGGANSAACSNATGGFFGRAGFAVGTGVSGGSGYILGLPGVIGGETRTGGTTGAFKVSGKGVMIADESSIANVEACYDALVPNAIYTDNPCATATGGFLGKWGFAIGTGASTTTSGLKGYVWGRPGVISGETQTGGTSGAFSLSGGGLFVAADNSNLSSVISCYSSLAGDVSASCTGAAGAFIGKNGLALGASGGPYAILNPNLLEISDSVQWIRIRSNGNIDVSGTITAASDIRLKQNIESLEVNDQLKNIAELNPVTYTLKADNKDHKHLGFIAQEVQKIFPELVYVNEKTGTLSLNYLGFIAPLTRAVQALIDLFANVDKKQVAMQAELQEQNAKIEAQNKVITEQNEKILKLQNDVAWLLREKSK